MPPRCSGPARGTGVGSLSASPHQAMVTPQGCSFVFICGGSKLWELEPPQLRSEVVGAHPEPRQLPGR